MSVSRPNGNMIVRVIDALNSLKDVKSEAGWFETAHYPDGGPPVAYVASIHEFGAPAASIPPRPFMRPAMAEYGQKWMDGLKDGAAAVVRGEATADQVLEIVALTAAGDIADKISQVDSPPLSMITLIGRAAGGITGGRDVGAAAGLLKDGPPNIGAVSRKPLVWTGQLIQSVTGRISRG